MVAYMRMRLRKPTYKRKLKSFKKSIDNIYLWY